MKPQFLHLFFLAISYLFIVGCNNQKIPIAQSNFEKETIVLADLIHQRLGYMKDVAAYKLKHQLAIEDIPREKVVIANGLNKARTLGLDTLLAKSFLEHQITLAKQVQMTWWKDWETNELPEASIRDLETEVRPALIQLGNKILTQIEVIKALSIKLSDYKLGKAIFRENLNAKGLKAVQKEDLYEKYWSIIAPLKQTSILITGKIEVDTTLTIEDIKNLPAQEIDTIKLKNGAGKTYKQLENVKGVLLTDLINIATIEGMDNKTSSAYYVICTAVDNYKAIYSWNELVNSQIGKAVYVLYAADNQLFESTEKSFMMVSLEDEVNGKRNLRELVKIEILSAED